MSAFNRSAVALALILGLSVLTIPGTAHGAVSPCAEEAASSYFAGGLSPYQASLWGAKATIEIFDPDVCGQSSSSVAWVMVTAASEQYLGGQGYAQVGYGRFGADVFPQSQGFKTFSQHLKCYVVIYGVAYYCGSGTLETLTLDHVKTFFAPGPTGAVQTYKTVFNDSDDKIHMYYGGTQLAETNFLPLNVWDNDWQGQFFGETKHKKTDIVGRQNDKVRFSDLEKSNDRSVNWVSLNNVTLPATNVDRYHRQWVNQSQSTDFRIWTDPLNSL